MAYNNKFKSIKTVIEDAYRDSMAETIDYLTLKTQDPVLHELVITLCAEMLQQGKLVKNYDEAKGAWKNSRSLTLHQKGDLGGEMPNPQTLQEKIERAKKLIQQSY